MKSGIPLIAVFGIQRFYKYIWTDIEKAFNSHEIAAIEEFCLAPFQNGVTQGLAGAGAVEISAGLERVLTIQFQQRRDTNQHFGYLTLVNA